jgi:type IV pilus assembly protein PilC
MLNEQDRQGQIARQASYLIEHGLGREALEQRLNDVFEPEALESFLAQTRSMAEGPSLGPILKRLMAAAAQSGLDQALMARALESLRDEIRQSLRPLSRLLDGQLVLVLLTSVVATLMVIVMKLYVFPQFADLYTIFGADLPALTRLAIETNWLAGLILIPWLVLLLLFWIKQALRARLRLSRELRGWILWVPFIGQLLRRFEAYLFFRLFVLLRALGATDEQAGAMALDALGHQAGQPAPALIEPIDAGLRDAIRLGIEAREMDYWQLAFLDLQSGASVELIRRVITHVLTILLGLTLGLVLIALYLPIFKLAAVV